MRWLSRCTTLCFVFYISGCSPITSTTPFYSSSSLDSGPISFISLDNVVGLQDEILRNLFNDVSCQDFESRLWDHIYLTLFNQTPPPPPSLVKKRIKSYAQTYLTNKGAHPRVVRKFASHFTEIYSMTFDFFSEKPKEVILDEIAQIDLFSDSDLSQNQYTDRNIIQFLYRVQKPLNQLKGVINSLGLKCQSLPPSSIVIQKNQNNIPIFSKMKNRLHPLVYGARKVMATAYQSCSVLKLPLLSPKQLDTRGIVKVSRHQGGGTRRAISSLSAVNQSHYYLRHTQSHLNPNQCFDVSKNPLIYDFGGKPSVSSYPYTQMNLFKNAGSGSSVLGVDCSGFVMASLASGGLRISPGKAMKGSYISGISSWRLLNPTNGLHCLNVVTARHPQTILQGDIIAARGHVVIVDQVGKDPLGLSSIKSIGQCHKKNISLDQFNFSIIHSSSSFNGIGINRIHARNIEASGIKRGLVQLASNLCYQKFGYSIPEKTKYITISRHNLSQACVENEMYIQGQECLTSCFDSSAQRI